MKLTKYTHSCVRFDDGDRALVIDPGVFSEAEIALDGAHGVLITHDHPDHIDGDAIRAAAAKNSDLRIWAPSSVAQSLADLGERVSVVEGGSTFEAAGFSIETFGGQHAVIHPSIPVIANLGYLVEGSVYHPGDSFSVPSAAVQTVLIPAHAPWSKLSEVIDFAIAVHAPQAFQIHDSLLTGIGLNMVEGNLTRLAQPYGIEFRHLNAQESLTV
jgi:glyoxylase-like metal-dependent hydrolase (beta-lactamase superfamily II)